MARTPLVLLAALGIVLCAPTAPALAATASLSGSTLVYDAAAGESNSLTLSRSGSTYTFYDSSLSSVTAGAGCTSSMSAAGPLPYVDCSGAGVTAILIRLADGNDVAQVAIDTSLAVALTVELGDGNDSWTGHRYGSETVYGGGGDDSIDLHDGDDVARGGDGNDTISGQGGNDTLYGDGGRDTLVGGDGNDVVDGGSGNDNLMGADGADTVRGGAHNDLVGGGLGADRVYGGSGNDRLRDDERLQQTAYRSRDVLRGGLGVDTVDYSYRLGEATPLRLSIDNRANDGAIGEGDNIGVDVENLIGGIKADVLVGSIARNVIRGREGNDVIVGGAGNDVLNGDAGADRINGGAGNDRLEGWWGRDYLVGGAGSDYISGGVDADVVVSRDRTRDVVTCGGGRDYAIVDAIDRVTWLCDVVRR